MANKICPNCGAKNPDSAYSCQKCAASLVEIPSPTGFSGSWSSTSSQQMPQEKTLPSQGTQTDSSTFSVSQSNQVSTAGEPIVVVRQSPWSKVLNAVLTSFFFLIFGFSAGLGSFGFPWSILYIAAIVGIPLIVGYFMRPKFIFYNSFFEKEARKRAQRIDYSEMQSIVQKRGRISILLKPKEQARLRNRVLVIPGNPKLSVGSDLATFLNSKIPSDKKAPDQDKLF